ncbi:O-methyltransferase-domain-containing protein [Ustulina deusta]|nr:O-methyltransferase-domain-containing protein [Ustulina deusta]
MGDLRSRNLILELAVRAKQGVHNPASFMTELRTQQQQYACLRWLCHFKVLAHIPIAPSSLSYEELALASGVPKNTLRSVTRMVITMGFLCETSEGRVAHNSLSAPFVEDPHLMTWLLHTNNHTVPYMNAMTEATERFGGSTEINETAFNIAAGTDLAFFPYLNSRPDLEKEFDAYMHCVSEVNDGLSADHLLNGFDWESLSEGAQVVDVGGGSGNTSLTVARAFKKLRFIVQDQATPIANAQRRKTETHRDEAWQRIALQEHDFFGPQPVRGAEIYLLRMVIHDWPDEKAVQILQQLAQAMSPTSRLLIMDMVIPAPGSTSIVFEAALREKDLCMLQTCNAKEREGGDWRNLIRKINPPMSIRAIRRPDGCLPSVIEVALGYDNHSTLVYGETLQAI